MHIHIYTYIRIYVCIYINIYVINTLFIKSIFIDKSLEFLFILADLDYIAQATIWYKLLVTLNLFFAQSFIEHCEL